MEMEEDDPKKGTCDSRQVLAGGLAVFCVIFAAVVIVLAVVVIEKKEEVPETSAAVKKLEYEIRTTWDDLPVNHMYMRLDLSAAASQGDLHIHVEGHFFNDPHNPGGTPGEPFPQLWNYEVAEAFFLNDKNDYLEVELSPHGQHLLLMLRGERNMVKDMLPISYNSTIMGNTWQGDAVIPGSYFPAKVTKFNAYAIHGTDPSRIYESLYPVPTGNFSDPDFHRLEFFQSIDLRSILPNNYNTEYTSPQWEEIDQNHPRFEITTTWDSKPIDHKPVQIVLSNFNVTDLNIHVEGPFFNDPPNPGGEVGKPFDELWNYEVAEAFFLNDADDYLEVELSPHGQHLLLMLRGVRNAVKKMLNITYTAIIRGGRWRGDAVIPGNYFPPNITKFNAYAIHGSNVSRTYESLYPVPTGLYKDPDFHKLEYFRDINLRNILPNNYNDNYDSSLWDEIPRNQTQ